MSAKRVYIALLVLLVSMVAQGASESYGVDDYNRWAKLSTDELMLNGQYFLRDKGLVDSALVCYAIVSSRESQKMKREEKYLVARATNNLGYIYAAYYYDYQKAYEYLNHSLELCKQYAFTDLSPYAYMNLASVINSRDELYGDNSLSSEALDNTKLAFEEAIKAKEWNVAVTSIFNMLNMVREKSDIQLIKPELDRFKSLPLTDSVEMLQCTRMFSNGIESYLAGQYEQSLKYFNQMMVEAQHLTTNRQQCIIKAMQQRGTVLAAMHRYDEALACLRQVEETAMEQDQQSDLIDAYHAMAEVYKAMGNKQLAEQFDYKYLRARDEFIHKSHAERVEKSRFLDEMRRVNEQVAQIEAKHERAHQLLLMVSLIAAIILTALVLLVRSYLRQRNYIRHLYEKNVELLEVRETSNPPVVQPAVHPVLAAQEETAPKYQSTLDQESKDRLFSQIKQVMDNMEIICQPDFSLQQLAEQVGSNYKYVSQVVNEYYGKSFKQVLNEQRVREACRMLNDTKQFGHLTIEAIAAKLGFNSRSNFTVTFKRITGISPSDFLKMAKGK